MLFTQSPLFDCLYEQISVMPVIDCHEHLTGPEARPPYKEPIASMICGYMLNDLHSAAFGISEKDIARLEDQDISTDEKWPLFERLWRATEHTAYARVTKLVLKNVYGESELTHEALDRVAEKLDGERGIGYAVQSGRNGCRAAASGGGGKHRVILQVVGTRVGVDSVRS